MSPPTIPFGRVQPIQILLLLLAVLCVSHRIVLAQQDAEEIHLPPDESASEEEETLMQQVHLKKDDRDQHAHYRLEPGEARQAGIAREEEPIPQEDKGEDVINHFSGLSRDKNGIWKLETYENFAQVLKENKSDRPHGLLLALLYTHSESCEADHDPWLAKLEDAALYARENLAKEDLQSGDIQFGSLDTAQWQGAAEWLEGIGVETTPTLVFIVARNARDRETPGASHAFLLDYIGPLETAQDVGNTVLQYYARLFLTSATPTTFHPFPSLPDDFAAQIVPRQFPNIAAIREFSSSDFSWKIASSVQNKPGGVSQHWSQIDRHFIQWLMSGSAEGQQPITLQIQCQAGPDLAEFTVFAEMAWILSSRRDVWFVGVKEECPPELNPGQVGAYQFVRDQDDEKSWDTPVAVSTKPDDLSRFLIHHSTPVVLWFDRYATAPIAFADDYEVHLLLLVNLHPLKNEVPRYSERLQRVLQDFHQQCTKMKQIKINRAICLIVPSTQTRILTTFGIDFWSPLDDHLSRNRGEPPPPTFPTLLITDRRPRENRYRDGTITATNSILRFPLRPPDIFADEAVTQFIKDFWKAQLLPELRSTLWRDGDVKVNKFGVTTLNAVEFQQRFQTTATTHEHALVLFTQPSCGHCKRFHSIYNEASKIVRNVHWDSHMALYKVEVSQSNEVHGIPLPWLPDVYYFPPNSMPNTEKEPSHSLPVAPVQYEATDQFGNGVGRLSDPLDLIEWWLDVIVVEGNFLDPDVLLNILDNKDEGSIDEE